MKRALIFVAALVAGGLTCTRAQADQVTTQIAPQPKAPVSIQRCQIDALEYAPQAWVNIQNRSNHQLITVDVQYSFYDADKAMFSQVIMKYTPSAPIAAGDIQQFSGNFWGAEHSEPFHVTSYVACRVNAATFTGQRSWRYGQQWKEPLVGAAATQSSVDETASAAGMPNLKVAVLSAWQDLAPQNIGGIYVHDRISIAGASRTVSVHPHDFVLKVHTPDEHTASLRGLSAPVPKYAKVNYGTNQTTWIPEVAAAEDLGALGALDVPAGGSATTVVTFYVPMSIDTTRISDVAFL